MTHNPIVTEVSDQRDALYHWLTKAGHKNILAVADENTAPIAASIIKSLSTARLLTLSPTPGSLDLVPDEVAIGKIFIAAAPYQAKASALIGIGSGTICDLVRYVSFRLGIPYYIVATAASMDGYTSTVTAPIVNNLKQTYPATPPAGVLAISGIYKNAPSRLTAAGFGDIMGKFTSVTDWEMEGIVEKEADNFCQDLANEMRRITEWCFNTKTPTSIMHALIESGLIMQKCGHSRAAAGSEHHLSHYWEMSALQEGKPPALHGAKVGVATLYVLQAQKWLLDEDITNETWAKAEAKAASFDEPAWKDEMRNCYANAADEIFELWPDETAATRLALIKRIRAEWPRLQSILCRNTGLGPKVKAAIENMGGPITPAELGVNREEFASGVLYAYRLRRRFTTWRLLDLLGLLPEYAERLAYEI